MIDVNAIRARLDPMIHGQMMAQGIPGLAIALTDRDRTLWVSAYGYSDPAAGIPLSEDMLFETGSIGKSFTSIALLQEQEAGRLELDAPVTEYLPWFEVQSSHAPITIHHLLSHSAGLVNTPDFSPDSRALVWALRETEVGWAPGERFAYSNDGYKTLGLVLNAITGRSYADVIRSRILNPLGMHSTDPIITQATRRRLAVGHAPLDDDRPSRRGGPIAPSPWFETDTADGCLAAPVGDVAIYLRMLLNHGQGPAGQVLSEESFGLMSQRVIETDRGGERFYGYGLFTWEEDGHTMIGHGGGMPGFISSMVGDLDAGVGAVVLVNSIADPGVVTEYALRLLRAAASGADLPEPPSVSDPEAIDNGGEYAGVYTSGADSFAIRVDGTGLLLNWRGNRLPLERTVMDAFLVPHPDFALFPLRFHRDGNEIVAAVHGARTYVKDDSGGFASYEFRDEWAPYVGHYRSFSPWLSNFRVIQRDGVLMLVEPAGNEEQLEPAGDHTFKLANQPGHLRFGPMMDGQVISARLMTADYYRVDMP